MLIAWGLPGLWAQEFSAFVSKREVPVGEVFKVSFQLRGGRSGNLTPPNLDGFQLRGGPSQESSIQMVNGKVTESMTISYYLQGTRTGTFKIGSATMAVDGKELRSNPVEVKIVAARSNAAQEDGNNANAQRQGDIEDQLKQAIFLRALVSDRTVYQGEPLTVTYKLYERVRTSNLRPESSPSYEGFWVENIDVKNPPPKIEVVDGMQYRTYIVKKDILFPQRPGKLKIDPFNLSCVVQVQVTPRRQRQSIFDSFFGQYENYEYSFASAPVTITSKALPGNPPASYTGVVGKLELQASLDTTSVEAGDPLTLRLRLSGRGNLKRLQEPQINLPPDFEVYDPNVKERLSNSGSTLTGWRSYEYLIIPRNPGNYELPAIELSYFDSEKGRYQVLSSPSYQLTVTGEPARTASASTGGPSAGSELAVLNQDIRYITVTDGGLQPTGSSAFRPLFWWMFLLPIGLGGVLLLLRRKQAQDQNDVAGTRRRKAAKVAQKRLKVAQGHLQENQSKAFYDELVRALWGYLGDKFSLGQSELNREKAGTLLAQRGASEEQVQRLNQLLDTAEMALYAPSAAPGGMSGTYDTAARLITDLEEI